MVGRRLGAASVEFVKFIVVGRIVVVGNTASVELVKYIVLVGRMVGVGTASVELV